MVKTSLIVFGLFIYLVYLLLTNHPSVESVKNVMNIAIWVGTINTLLYAIIIAVAGTDIITKEIKTHIYELFSFVSFIMGSLLIAVSIPTISYWMVLGVILWIVSIGTAPARVSK